MALVIKDLERNFTFLNNNKKITLNDPNPDMSPEEVMNFYSNQYPELTTATVHGPIIESDKVFYNFKTTIGTKG